MPKIAIVALSLLLVLTSFPGHASESCALLDATDMDGDGSTVTADCDDNDPHAYPGAEEQCNGIDDNCDNFVNAYEQDRDLDGVRPCEGDRDDDPSTGASRYPGAAEISDRIDQDFDDLVDEGTVYADDDGDGFAEKIPGLDSDSANALSDCDDGADSVFPGAEDSAEEADGLDNDCDTLIDEGNGDKDQDGDGYTPLNGDCDDADAEVYPSAEELNDGLDNDCDGIQPVVQGCGRGLSGSAALVLLPGSLFFMRRRRRLLALALTTIAFSAAEAGAEPASARLAPPSSATSQTAMTQARIEAETKLPTRFNTVLPKARLSHMELLERAAVEMDPQWAIGVLKLRLQTWMEGAQQRLSYDAAEARETEARIGATEEHLAEAQRALDQQLAIAAAVSKAANAAQRLDEARSGLTAAWDLADANEQVQSLPPSARQSWAQARAAADAGDERLAIGYLQALPEPHPLQTENLISLCEQVVRLRSEADADTDTLRVLLPSDRALDLSADGVTQAHHQPLAQDEARRSASQKLGEDREALIHLERNADSLLRQAQKMRTLLDEAADVPVPALRDSAVEVARLFQETLDLFLGAPAPLSNETWAELFWRGGTAQILAGNEEVGFRWLEYAAAVAEPGLPLDQVPPTVAGWLGQAEAAVARRQRGTLHLFTHPDTVVYVDGVERSTMLGEGRVTLMPGYHLIVLQVPWQHERQVQISYVEGDTDLSLTWYPQRGPKAEDDSDALRSDLNATFATPVAATNAPAPGHDWRLAIGVRPLALLGQGAGLFGGGVGADLCTKRLHVWVESAVLGSTEPLWGVNGGISSTVLHGAMGAGPAGAFGSWWLSTGGGGWAQSAPPAGWMGGGPLVYGAAMWRRDDLQLGLNARAGAELVGHHSEAAARWMAGGGLFVGLAL